MYCSLIYHDDVKSFDTDWNGYTLVFTPLVWLTTTVAIASAFAVVHIIAKGPDIKLIDSLAFSVASFAIRDNVHMTPA